MIIAAVLAAHLLAGAQAQVPAKYQAQYQQALKYRQDPKKMAAMERRYLSKGKGPRTCADECDLIDKAMKDNCDQHYQGKPAKELRQCKGRGKDMVKTCRDSCRDKGRVDPQYLKSHLKKPQSPYGGRSRPGTGPTKSNFGNGEGN